MTFGEIKNLYEARPFRSFIIHIADGRALPVAHPEFLAFSPDGVTMFAYQPDGSHNIIDLSLVTDLEIKANSGAARRRKR